jgi:hypothetical protein
VPTLILHGDDDEIVPYADSALLSLKIVQGTVLKTYEGAPYGMCTTLKDKVNADFLAFIRIMRQAGHGSSYESDAYGNPRAVTATYLTDDGGGCGRGAQPVRGTGCG